MDHFSDLVREREAEIHEVRRILETKARVNADCLAAARKDAEQAPVASPVTLFAHVRKSKHNRGGIAISGHAR